MILKALYDYYNRCDNMPAPGTEEQQIGFVIVLSKEGKFLRFENNINDDGKSAHLFNVAKKVTRTAGVKPNYLYDNGQYVLGLSEKDPQRTKECRQSFADKIFEIQQGYSNSEEMNALKIFYENDTDTVLQTIKQDPLWEFISKNMNKSYSWFSFRIEGDRKIVAEKAELMPQEQETDSTKGNAVCLITGKRCIPVELTSPTPIAGGKTNGKLVAVQVSSGYDSYKHEKAGNSPISKEAEFKYSAALSQLLKRDSHNKFMVGSRTFVFWASKSSEAGVKTEQGLYDLLGFVDNKDNDDPNSRFAKVRDVFNAIYTGKIKTDTDDRFYILGMAPNAARIAVTYWSETTLQDFAYHILKHFDDMEICGAKDGTFYKGLKNMLSAVTLGGKVSDVAPNMPEAVIKSIFQGLPYPYTLFASCIRRIRAENSIYTGRAAIIKAYINRKNNNNKISIMLDTDYKNQGYLCGRLFAVLDSIQFRANGISSIRERYMNAASSTPSAVFSTIMNLSLHHSEKLNSSGAKIFYEKLKQEIIDKLPADGFPAHLDMQDQGRFFVGYYHQRQELLKKKEINIDNEQ